MLKKEQEQESKLVKDFTTENLGKSIAIQDQSGECLTVGPEILNRWIEYFSDIYNNETDGIRWYLTAHRYQMKTSFLSYE